MSKIIRMTPECASEILKDFAATLNGAKLVDGKISFTKTFGQINRKAKLYFKDIAWTKMQSLVREFDKEVAWHGVAFRGTDPSKDEYYIEDILVYPQEVTGATVNTDQQKYQTWLMGHEDEVFNNIRMQGHSHVNMSTSPSGVDLTHQEQILNQLDDDMFYIFVIWNKRNEKTVKIYDLAKNILFETYDVTIEVLEDETGIETFIKNAKSMVQNKTVAPITSYSYSGGYGKHGYSSPNTYAGAAGGTDKRDVKSVENKEPATLPWPTSSSKSRKGKKKR